MQGSLKHGLATATLLFGVQQAAGCNAAFGIEEAQLAALDTCDVVIVEPQSDCPSSAACDTCLAGCSTFDLDDCKNDDACRLSLQQYRWCLQANEDCVDEGGRCLGCLDPSGVTGRIRACLADCSDSCRGALGFTLCDLYSACMANKCGGQARVDACETPDDSVEVWKTACRLAHCELGEGSGGHCRHAVSLDNTCIEATPRDDRCENASLALNGYPCTGPNECCSGVCQGLEQGAGKCVPVGG